jgi:HAD superfamily hydrolase (TIGR01484 family)
MIAFASDLDRTLIYSKTMLDTYHSENEHELIETLDEREISYMSLTSKEALKKLNEDLLFIPVTTRSIAQYKRIRTFQQEIIPQYAITSNGGYILKDNRVLDVWTDHIREELKVCLPLDEMINKLRGMSYLSWIEKIKEADHLFVYLIINRSKVDSEKIEEIRKWAEELGWQMSLQGRKMYFVPHPINKWKAVQFLCDKLNIKTVFAAGDSLLDYDLISRAHYGISPLHGEVLAHYPVMNKTSSSGIDASEEILRLVRGKADELLKPTQYHSAVKPVL